MAIGPPRAYEADVTRRAVSDERPVRVLIAKPGLDGHDRGAKAVVLALRDAGMEVIYTGLHWAPLQIARAALQEDVDVVGLSLLSGNHLALSKSVVDEVRALGLDDVLIVVGGAIPQADVSALREIGVDAVFPRGARFEDIVASIRDNVRRGSVVA